MKIYEDLVYLLEEFINELDDETVQAVSDKRKENADKAQAEFQKVIQDGKSTGEDAEVAAKKANHAKALNIGNKKLVAQRNARREKALADFKEKLINAKPQTKAQTQQADSEHSNAIIDQHFRNKLEKALAVSNECFESLISLIEGEVINFQEKKKQKILDKNAEKMAQMMQDGSLDAVRVLPNNELIGDPVAIKKVKDIQAENREVIDKCRKHG